MRIVFICGSLEPVKDGVGDYTRKLAGAFISLGLTTCILSINDAYVNEPTYQIQHEGCVSIDVLRLPSSASWKERAKKAKLYIDQQAPDWLSLQYVPYAFNKKGLPFGLGNWIKQLGNGRKWHIMFHELWLGIKRDAPPSHYIYGFLQKRLISALKKKLSPVAISTSNRIYQLELQKRKIEANLLPLFSNIALLPASNKLLTTINQQLSRTPDKADTFFILGGFGAVHHGMDLPQILREQKAAADRLNKKLVYITFGRSSFDQKALSLQEELKDVALFCNLGELAEQEISTVLQMLNLGVCGTPKEYIGKSGVYAAMKRHGLPVIIRSGMVIPEYEVEIEEFNAYLESREAYQWDVKYIASQFYESIR